MAQSKIEKYKLEEEIASLYYSGLTYRQIVDEITSSGKLPDGEELSAATVSRFIEKVAGISKEVVKSNEKRLVEVVNNNIDIVRETSDLYSKARNILDTMEEAAADKGRVMNPHHFKAISGEMRETLKLMIEIQREISDYDNIKQFMEIIMETVKEVSPEAIPIIIDKLKNKKGTKWFGDMFGGGGR
ncbi:hypothetical protein SAMN05446037_100699 [Anaerovirgula multivorans]|uniref:Uncharacterized protein n=1 Tax=Anaerovirgula multivorans TaxID=312168 RepID=A0A239CQL5_9FIRM|nr:hypothetical protein [Anaerovirgula multivorans]SNS22397.1 hypothetical protein SAMN05446037_100699 [Anaerovirgula multivorans]